MEKYTRIFILKTIFFPDRKLLFSFTFPKKMEQITNAKSNAEKTKRNQDSENDLRHTKWREVGQMLTIERDRIEKEKQRGQQMITVIEPDNNNERAKIIGKKSDRHAESDSQKRKKHKT